MYYNGLAQYELGSYEWAIQMFGELKIIDRGGYKDSNY